MSVSPMVSNWPIREAEERAALLCRLAAETQNTINSCRDSVLEFKAVRTRHLLDTSTSHALLAAIHRTDQPRK